MQQRLREGYRAVAAREPERWIVIDNSDEDLTRVIDRVVTLIEHARTAGVAAALAETRRPAPAAPAISSAPATMSTPQEALAAFLRWVDARSAREPALAAYVLASLAGPAIDERRLALTNAAPRVLARGLRGMIDPVSWRLRHRLLDDAPDEVALSLVEEAARPLEAWRLREILAAVSPAEVAQSLQELDDETAWALRAELYPLVPDAVMMSLAMLDSPRAWALRDRWIADHGGMGPAVASYDPARAAARSVTGLEDERAWQIRRAARDAAPAAALASLRGATGERAWRWRQRALERAPKPVLVTIAGSDDPRAWEMRAAMAPRCREALDSMIGLDHLTAWQIRERCLEIWPATVIKSLGPLVNGAHGHALLMRALETFPENISLLKQAAAVATGGDPTPNVMAA
jgi:dTMP kinase